MLLENILDCLNTNLFESLTYPVKPDTKPSPSKRLCPNDMETQAPSSENVQPVSSSSTSHDSPQMTSEPHKTASNRAPLVQPLENAKQNSKSETPATLSVKTRMQKLAEQRRCWDSEGMFHLLSTIGVSQCLHWWLCWLEGDNVVCAKINVFLKNSKAILGQAQNIEAVIYSLILSWFFSATLMPCSSQHWHKISKLLD